MQWGIISRTNLSLRAGWACASTRHNEIHKTQSEEWCLYPSKLSYDFLLPSLLFEVI